MCEKIRCFKCKEEKELNEFHNSKRNLKHGKNGKCKSCSKIYHKENRDIILKRQRENYNKEDAIKRVYEWRIKKYGDKAKQREEKKLLKEKIKKEKEEVSKYKKTILNPLKATIRTSLWFIFRKKKFSKDNKTESYLGCDYESLKNHIEKQFTKGMTWENKEYWHIDHIVPLSVAKNKEELIELSHYSNIQPMWAIINLRKNNKVYSVTNLITKKTYNPLHN